MTQMSLILNSAIARLKVMVEYSTLTLIQPNTQLSALPSPMIKLVVMAVQRDVCGIIVIDICSKLGYKTTIALEKLSKLYHAD